MMDLARSTPVPAFIVDLSFSCRVYRPLLLGNKPRKPEGGIPFRMDGGLLSGVGCRNGRAISIARYTIGTSTTTNNTYSTAFNHIIPYSLRTHKAKDYRSGSNLSHVASISIYHDNRQQGAASCVLSIKSRKPLRRTAIIHCGGLFDATKFKICQSITYAKTTTKDPCFFSQNQKGIKMSREKLFSIRITNPIHKTRGNKSKNEMDRKRFSVRVSDQDLFGILSFPATFSSRDINRRQECQIISSMKVSTVQPIALQMIQITNLITNSVMITNNRTNTSLKASNSKDSNYPTSQSNDQYRNENQKNYKEERDLNDRINGSENNNNRYNDNNNNNGNRYRKTLCSSDDDDLDKSSGDNEKKENSQKNSRYSRFSKPRNNKSRDKGNTTTQDALDVVESDERGLQGIDKRSNPLSQVLQGSNDLVRTKNEEDNQRGSDFSKEQLPASKGQQQQQQQQRQNIRDRRGSLVRTVTFPLISSQSEPRSAQWDVKKDENLPEMLPKPVLYSSQRSIERVDLDQTTKSSKLNISGHQPTSYSIEDVYILEEKDINPSPPARTEEYRSDMKQMNGQVDSVLNFYDDESDEDLSSNTTTNSRVKITLEDISGKVESKNDNTIGDELALSSSPTDFKASDDRILQSNESNFRDYRDKMSDKESLTQESASSGFHPSNIRKQSKEKQTSSLLPVNYEKVPTSYHSFIRVLEELDIPSISKIVEALIANDITPSRNLSTICRQLKMFTIKRRHISDIFIKEPWFAGATLDSQKVELIILYFHNTIKIPLQKVSEMISRRPDLLLANLGGNPFEPPGIIDVVKLIAYTGLKQRDIQFLLLQNPGLPLIKLERLEAAFNFLTSDSVGFAINSMKQLVKRNPWVLCYDVELEMRPVVKFFTEIGVQDKRKVLRAHPQLFGCNVAVQLRVAYRFLVEDIGILYNDVAKIVTIYPAVLSTSVEQVLRPAWRYMYQDIGINPSELVNVIKAFPNLLLLYVERDMKPKIKFLREERQIINIARFVQKNPAILTFDFQKEFLPKVYYIEKQFGLSVFEWTSYPAIFSYPLQDYVKARLDFLRAYNVTIVDVGIGKILTYTDAMLCEKIASVSVETFYDILKSQGVYENYILSKKRNQPYFERGPHVLIQDSCASVPEREIR